MRAGSSFISVVVPTFNGAGLIEFCLESVLGQTLLPREIVIVDDLSSDDTIAIARRWQAECEIPIRIFSLAKNSGGPSRPLNLGIKEARGDIICVLEQDDIMPPERIERQVEALLEFPESALVVGRCDIIDQSKSPALPEVYTRQQFASLGELFNSDSNSPVLIKSEAAFAGLLRHNFSISNSNFMFTKKSWEACGGFNEAIKTCADVDFALRAACVGPIAITPHLTLKYRVQMNSLNRRDKRLAVQESLAVRMSAIRRRPMWGRNYFWERLLGFCKLLKRQVRKLELKKAAGTLTLMYRARMLSTWLFVQFRKSGN